MRSQMRMLALWLCCYIVVLFQGAGCFYTFDYRDYEDNIADFYDDLNNYVSSVNFPSQAGRFGRADSSYYGRYSPKSPYGQRVVQIVADDYDNDPQQPSADEYRVRRPTSTSYRRGRVNEVPRSFNPRYGRLPNSRRNHYRNDGVYGYVPQDEPEDVQTEEFGRSNQRGRSAYPRSRFEDSDGVPSRDSVDSEQNDVPYADYDVPAKVPIIAPDDANLPVPKSSTERDSEDGSKLPSRVFQRNQDHVVRHHQELSSANSQNVSKINPDQKKDPGIRTSSTNVTETMSTAEDQNRTAKQYDPELFPQIQYQYTHQSTNQDNIPAGAEEIQPEIPSSLPVNTNINTIAEDLPGSSNLLPEENLPPPVSRSNSTTMKCGMSMERLEVFLSQMVDMCSYDLPDPLRQRDSQILYHKELQGLSSIYKVSPAIVECSQNSINVKFKVGFKELEGSSPWKFGVFRAVMAQGMFKAKIMDLYVDVQLCQPKVPGAACKIDRFEVKGMQEMDIDVETGGMDEVENEMEAEDDLLPMMFKKWVKNDSMKYVLKALDREIASHPLPME